MEQQTEVFTLPRGRAATWLLHAGADIPRAIRVALVGSLFGTLPIFAGGVLNTVAVAWVLDGRHPTPAFHIWLALEIAVCLVRLVVLVVARRRARERESTLTDTYVLLAPLWGATVGYGALVSVLSGDWVAATLSFLSAAAMVGGICFRNFGAPRLVAVMIFLSLGPCCIGAVLSGEPTLWLTLLQIPFYLFAMSAAAWRLNGMLVSTMKAEQENDRRARHDELTGLLNRAGLFRAVRSSAPEHTALLYLDLDGFKAINDAHGHEIGDTLLALVARRLRHLSGEGSLVARLGGDEFVIVTPPQADPLALADVIVRELSKPFVTDAGAMLEIGVSIGVAMFDHHHDELDGVLRDADNALYEAKRAGKSRRVLAGVRESAGLAV
ncbi:MULTISPECIES: GGDEF domain-containing protein [Caballeronia]|uniref:Diguanylate cyclase n=1 Tax=Caballeronia zhejiangensis TaxID=871203 RepID=A0A656Q8U7_9BURK|nr:MULTISPECIES: GGDEF domain-containing protein [Caballeronia]KDR25054.1 diguanylate cyclase [Caballeronia zhejiangensis]MDR5791341.1 GGDEF domain-containing protein [Caballeronia sp. LP003]